MNFKDFIDEVFIPNKIETVVWTFDNCPCQDKLFLEPCYKLSISLYRDTSTMVLRTIQFSDSVFINLYL